VPDEESGQGKHESGSKTAHQDSRVKKLIICINYRANPAQPSCAARGSKELADRLEREIAARGWDIRLERFFCLGRCAEGPNLKLVPGGGFISGITPEKLQDVLLEIEAFLNSWP
jgi:(2Fe-2S) ferredoxin